jgi:hypothetical protein
MPKNGVVADRHAKTLHQPLSRSATRAMPKKMNKFSGSIRPTTVRTNHLRQAIHKCPTLPFPVQTSPAAYLHPHHHRGALRRQVLKMTDIPAVPPCRWLAAIRTGAYSRPYGRDHPAIVVPLHSNNPHAGPRSPIHILSHAHGYRQGRRPHKNSTESEADPITCTFSTYLFVAKALKSLIPDSHG